MNGCPNDAPVELADGTVLQPDDTVRVRDLCEIVPLIIETMQAAAAAAPGAKGQVAPGMSVPVRGGAPGFTSPVAPGFGGRPGSISGAPGFGQQGQGGGGGGGFGGGGGGGRGAPGPAGPPGAPGAQGPPGLGNVIGGQLKTSGSFTVSGAPQVIPNYFVNFNVSQQGNVTIRASATFRRSPFGAQIPDVQFGLQVDGGAFIMLAQFAEQQGAGDDQIFATHLMIELFLENMAPGAHVVRGVYTGGPPGSEMTFVAEPDMPAMLVVQGP